MVITSSNFNANEIAKCGMPCKKFVVPSIGSIIQNTFLFLFIIFPVSSVIKEKFFFDFVSSSTKIFSTLLSVLVTKSLGPFLIPVIFQFPQNP